MRLPNFPEHMLRYYGSRRGFKQTKRKQLRAVDKALDDFRTGCAYLPVREYRTTMRLLSDVEDLKCKLSVKKWGR